MGGNVVVSETDFGSGSSFHLERVTNPCETRKPPLKPGAPQLTRACQPSGSRVVVRMEMPSAATSTDSRRATGERRTFEMKPTSQAWQAARKEPQSPPLIRSWNENLDSTANGFPSSA